MTQIDLLSVADRSVDPSEVEILIQCLRGKGWITRRLIERALGWNDRTIRAVAQVSQGRVISGQKGYSLIEEATVEDANHAANWLKHQADQMTKRAYEIRQQMHRCKRDAA